MPAPPSTIAEILPDMEAIFRAVFGNAGITLSTESTSDTIAGWDSFKFVEIIVNFETRFAIELEGSEIDDVQNVGDLAALILRKINEV